MVGACADADRCDLYISLDYMADDLCHFVRDWKQYFQSSAGALGKSKEDAAQSYLVRIDCMAMGRNEEGNNLRSIQFSYSKKLGMGATIQVPQKGKITA